MVCGRPPNPKDQDNHPEFWPIPGHTIVKNLKEYFHYALVMH